MRAGSLSREPLFSRLRNNYICGYRNIGDQKYAGNSGIHPITGPAVHTTNGAGPRNLQLFVLAPDGTVLHCMPGYWDARDIYDELNLAERLLRVWENKSIRPVQKVQMFKTEHLKHMALHTPATVKRSKLQGFDKKHIWNHQDKLGDAIADRNLLAHCDSHHLPDAAFKTTDVIMHERMSLRPFLSYERFDVPHFVNYGTMHYDKGEHKLDPKSTASIRSHNLRDLIFDTWQEKKVSGSSKQVARSRSERKGKKLKLPHDFEQKMRDSFWRYLENRQYGKAKRLAKYKIERDTRSPVGYQMRAVLNFTLKNYKGACYDAWWAMKLGSRHPKLMWLYKTSLALSKKPQQVSTNPN